MAANPNQAIVVMCQAKRSVFLVKASFPKSLGSGCRKSRIRMYFSPRYECAMPMATVNTIAMKSMITAT